MDILYVKYDQIDDRKWDDCIRRSVNARIYAYSWYLNIVCDRWDALIEGDYERVFPLPYRVKAGVKYAFMPPFTQQLGLFSGLHLNPSLVKDFLSRIPVEFQLVDLNLNTLNRLESKDFVRQQNRNFELDLISDYEKLSSKYSSNVRRNISRAEKADLQRVDNISPSEVIGLFRANRGRSIDTLKDSDYRILERLMHSLLHQRKLQIIGATAGPNQLMAAIVVAEEQQRSILLFSATERRDDNHGALAWLIDHYIHSKSGLQRVLDFEGSNDPGLARFYGGFGAAETNYLSIHINRLSPIMRLALVGIRNWRKFVFRFRIKA